MKTHKIHIKYNLDRNQTCQTDSEMIKQNFTDSINCILKVLCTQ